MNRPREDMPRPAFTREKLRMKFNAALIMDEVKTEYKRLNVNTAFCLVKK